MFGIGDKKKSQKGGGSSKGSMKVPVDEVTALSSRGFSEPEIVNALKKQGYSIPEIDDAMKTALRSAATGPGNFGANDNFGAPPDNMPKGNSFQPPPGMDLDHPTKYFSDDANMNFDNEPQNQFYGPMNDQINQNNFDNNNYPRQNDFGSNQQGFQNDFDMPTGNQFSGGQRRASTLSSSESQPLPSIEEETRSKKVNKKQIEELVEVIIEEKWHDMKSKLNEMDTKFLDLNNKIVSLENSMRQMRSERNDELRQIESKIDEYKNTMNDMNGKMQSMENAMRDSLTPLISTLRSLSETINNLKEKKGL